MTNFTTPPYAGSQRAKILNLLLEAQSDWVPLPEIMACAAQYNSRIFELRRLGHVIQNRTQHIDGMRHSWFRLVACPPIPSPQPLDPLSTAALGLGVEKSPETDEVNVVKAGEAQ